jgi:hypothetical protein
MFVMLKNCRPELPLSSFNKPAQSRNHRNEQVRYSTTCLG